METPENPSPHTTGSWGAIISILLILVIVVVGAYYSFHKRVSTSAVQMHTSY